MVKIEYADTRKLSKVVMFFNGFIFSHEYSVFT